ncbi:MAG: tRNA (N6-threonylcarbamoyladenosine(37)-N6)-methyltransferase TrmO [Candidatus Thorarchaeota archaeon]
MELGMRTIGIIRTSFESGSSVPIQSSKSDIIGEALIDNEFVDGLESLDLFSHAILLYWFHRASPPKLKVVPYLDKRERGLFSTRSPSRPNPVGISIVKLLRIEDNRIVFKGADMLDGSPLIDIKPFIPEFDCRPDANSGWLREFLDKEGQSFLGDSRFED